MPDKKKHPKRVYPNQYDGMLTKSIPELLEWYRDTLRDLQSVYESYTAEMNLYKDKSIYPDRNLAQQTIQRLEAERSQVSGMISDLEYCIEWMETARRPGNKRGIERRSYEQRTISKDPRWVQAMVKAQQGNQSNLTDADLQKLHDLLGCLTTEQHECFVLVKGHCYTFEEAGRVLGMSSSLVAYHLKEAEKRLQDKVAGGKELVLQGTLF